MNMKSKLSTPPYDCKHISPSSVYDISRLEQLSIQDAKEILSLSPSREDLQQRNVKSPPEMKRANNSKTPPNFPITLLSAPKSLYIEDAFDRQHAQYSCWPSLTLLPRKSDYASTFFE